MKNEDIAKLAGWKPTRTPMATKGGTEMDGWERNGKTTRRLPNYLGDLNACAEFERILTLHQRKAFALELQDTNGSLGCVFANAMARCEAFNRALKCHG